MTSARERGSRPGVNSRRRYGLVLLAVVLMASLPVLGQYAPPAQPAPAAVVPAEGISLVIEDFALLEGTEGSPAALIDLKNAVPDALYVNLLAYPQILVARGARTASLSPSVSETSKTHQSMAGSEGNSTANPLPGVPETVQRGLNDTGSPNSSGYTLQGQISMLAGSGSGSSTQKTTAVVIRYQLLKNEARAGSEAKVIGGDSFVAGRSEIRDKLLAVAGSEAKVIGGDSFVAGRSEIRDKLLAVARSVKEKIVPTLNVYIGPVEVNCVGSGGIKNFYQETLLGLLRSGVLGSGFANSSKSAADAFVVNETAEPDPNGCRLAGTVSNPKSQVVAQLAATGPASGIFDLQDKINQQVLDALRVESRSAEQPDLTEYLEQADRYQRSDPNLAAALYRKVLSGNPSDQDVKNKLAQTLLAANRPQEVIDLLRNPSSAADCVLLATAYLQTNDKKMAIKQLDAGLSLGSTDAATYQQISSLFEKAGDYGGGAKALDAGQKYAGAGDDFSGKANQLRRRGAAELITAGKYDEALELARASIQAEPKSEWGQRITGIAYLGKGDLTQAEEHLQLAIAVQPTAYSYAELGDIRLKQKEKDEATKFGEKAISTDPTIASGYSVLLDSVQDSASAAAVVSFLKQYARCEPPCRYAVSMAAYLQLKYFPKDAAGIHEQYETYQFALRNVPYDDWLEAWSNFVEAAMIDNHVEEAAKVATGLLGAKLSADLRMNMSFYSWLTYLLLGDCGQFQSNLDASLKYLRSVPLEETNSWDFSATEELVGKAHQEKKLTENGYLLTTKALGFMKHPGAASAYAQFEGAAAQLSQTACKAD